MPRSKGKEPLSQARIMRAAVRYADRQGIESLNMRRLAGILDAGVMSLYHYYPSRDELLDGMVEYVAAKIEQPANDEPWRDALTTLLVSARQQMRKHGWVCAIWSRSTLGPNRLAFMEAILRTLREAGFSVHDACDAYHALTIHVEGSALQASLFPVKGKAIQRAAKEFLGGIEDPSHIPYFVEHVQHHIDHPEMPDQFSMMLNLILDGYEAKLAATGVA